MLPRLAKFLPATYFEVPKEAAVTLQRKNRKTAPQPSDQTSSSQQGDTEPPEAPAPCDTASPPHPHPPPGTPVPRDHPHHEEAANKPKLRPF